MALEISDKHSAGELRAMVRREKNGQVANWLLGRPDLNPVERLWLYLRERLFRVFVDWEAIMDACCHAWGRAAKEAKRTVPLCNNPWSKRSRHRLRGIRHRG